MDLHKIEDDEMLYRVVRKSDPDGFIDGKPTAALFIDSRGASVDRDGGRNENEIVETFKSRFARRDDYSRSVKIQAGTCRYIGTFPNPVNNHKNKFHAEIHESETEKEISFLKALKLANQCQVVS